ncbi:MAG: hypothetical protein JNK04_20570, partial [Myxococcales bacterium]|nr:hypothetical protein [Myxococcales bacterium]
MKLLWSCVLALSGCGGLVVFQSDSSDDGGGGGGPTPPPIAGSVSTGPQPTTCSAHVDCAADELCIFQTGVCAPACEAESCDVCGGGEVCNSCATSACPKCNDCRGACVAAAQNQCDDNDPCDPGFVCDHFNRTCVPSCENG